WEPDTSTPDLHRSRTDSGRASLGAPTIQIAASAQGAFVADDDGNLNRRSRQGYVRDRRQEGRRRGDIGGIEAPCPVPRRPNMRRQQTRAAQQSRLAT